MTMVELVGSALFIAAVLAILLLASKAAGS